MKGNETETAAEAILRGTLSKDKNELLFSRFGINYNNEPEFFKKGSVVIREKRDLILKRMEEKPDTISLSLTKEQVAALSEGSYETVVLHCDVIRDSPFWEEHPDLLRDPASGRGSRSSRPSSATTGPCDAPGRFPRP